MGPGGQRGPSIYPSIHPSTHLSIHPSNYPPIYPSIHFGQNTFRHFLISKTKKSKTKKKLPPEAGYEQKRNCPLSTACLLRRPDLDSVLDGMPTFRPKFQKILIHPSIYPSIHRSIYAS